MFKNGLGGGRRVRTYKLESQSRCGQASWDTNAETSLLHLKKNKLLDVFHKEEGEEETHNKDGRKKKERDR